MCCKAERGWRTYIRRSDGSRSSTRLYRTWSSIFSRLRNKNNPRYHRYGGRGLKICPAWESYSVFRIWAISTGYRKGLSLDRIDNNDGYHPKNCQWVTVAENSRKARTVDNPLLGEKNPNSMLNDDLVREIRADRASGKTLNQVANKYGIGISHVSQICLKQRWRHVL